MKNLSLDVRLALALGTCLLVAGCSKQAPTAPVQSTSPTTVAPTAAPPAATRPNRPQDNTGPVPYQTREVGIEVQPGETDTALACTLSQPKAEGKHSAVFIASGSGGQDRHGSLYGHQPYKVLADNLTRAGIAVMRCDDRGIGGSRGKVTMQNLEAKAADVVAVVRFMRGLDTIDSKKVGVIGHSEGALVGAMAAVKSQSVAFVVMLAGVGASGRDALKAQLLGRLKTLNAPAPKQAVAIKAHENVMDAIASGAGTATLKKAATAQFNAMMELLPEDQHAAVERTRTGTVNLGVMRMVATSERSFLKSDAPKVLGALKVPVLALWGDGDQKLPPALHAAGARKALASNAAATVEVIKGVNHMLQPTKGVKKADDFAAIKTTIDGRVLARVASWLKAR